MGNDQAQADGVGEGVVQLVGRKATLELVEGDLPRFLGAERPRQRVFEAQHIAEPALRVPCLGELLDGREGVAPADEAQHELQAGEVLVAVVRHPALAPRAGQQAPLDVQAHVAHGRAGPAGELVHAELVHAGIVHAELRNAGVVLVRHGDQGYTECP